jgi:hypothetical protein
VTIENAVISTPRHLQKEFFKALFGFLAEQGKAKNASVGLFYRGTLFSGLLPESVDHGIFKVSDE